MGYYILYAKWWHSPAMRSSSTAPVWAVALRHPVPTTRKGVALTTPLYLYSVVVGTDYSVAPAPAEIVFAISLANSVRSRPTVSATS